MKVLVIHRAFPGQLSRWIAFFRDRGDDCIGMGARGVAQAVSGVPLIDYSEDGLPLGTGGPVAAAVIHLQRAGRAAQALEEARVQGLEPDLVFFHPGWGEGLFLREIFPHAKLIAYLEWYFDPALSRFDPEVPMPRHVEWEARARNTGLLHALDVMDAGVTPTRWQRSQIPEKWKDQVHVIHEGLDLAELKPNPALCLHLGEDLVSRHSSVPLVTFAARSLEPMRGFHWFMRALPKLFEQRPDARVMIAGSDGVTYSPPSAHPEGYRGQLIEELGAAVPWSRVHFVGFLDRRSHIGLLQMSSCHVYFSAPFVTSWSLLEAMAVGSPLVGSATGPVQEFLDLPEGEAGALVNPFSAEETAQAVCRVLQGQQTAPILQMVERARHKVRELDKNVFFRQAEELLWKLDLSSPPVCSVPFPTIARVSD